MCPQFISDVPELCLAGWEDFVQDGREEDTPGGMHSKETGAEVAVDGALSKQCREEAVTCLIKSP